VRVSRDATVPRRADRRAPRPQRLGIAVAVVVQALVFAERTRTIGTCVFAAVELVLPSIAWALIYLRFGLVPTSCSRDV
jgi:hypothetical protein